MKENKTLIIALFFSVIFVFILLTGILSSYGKLECIEWDNETTWEVFETQEEQYHRGFGFNEKVKSCYYTHKDYIDCGPAYDEECWNVKMESYHNILKECYEEIGKPYPRLVISTEEVCVAKHRVVR